MLPRNDELKIGDRVKIIPETLFSFENDGVGTLIREDPGAFSEGWWVRWDSYYYEQWYPKSHLCRVQG